MKKLILFFILSILLIGCATTKTSSEFLITKIQSEKDGQTLFLKNDKGQVYTTIISPANGNFVNVNQGDKISLDIKEIMEMEPPAIISKNIRIVEKSKLKRKTFLITKIRGEMDGKTLFLEDEKGQVYTTIISPANGNFIDVNEGDKISVEINDILEKMNPPAIISKNIEIVKE